MDEGFSCSRNYGVEAYGFVSGEVGDNFAIWAQANSTPTAAVAGANFGLWATATGPAPTNYGVYSSASGATTNWAYWANGWGYNSGPNWISSDARLKRDIQPLTNALSSLMKLRATTYFYDASAHPGFNLPDREQIGLISQEVEKVFPTLVMDVHQPDEVNAEGKVVLQGFDLKAMNYTGFIPVLIASVQEQQSIIDDKQAQIDELSSRLAALEKQMGSTPATAPAFNGATEGMTIAPNPFSDRTTITYAVGCDCRVQLQVTTADGKPLATLLDEQRAQGNYTHEWDTTGMAAGMYYCTLLVDGKPTVKRALKVTR